MKKLILILLVCFFVLSGILPAQTFRSLNFECGGYVSGVFPVKYNPLLELPLVGSQRIYVRTDIGGVYRSTDNGSNWTFISNFRSNMSPSELLIQGLAVKPKLGAHTSSDTLIVAWGNIPSDALESSVYSSLWKSTNGGQTWTRPTIESPGVVFSGNNFKMKIGGECIIYHPDSLNVLYMGGISPTTNTAPNLYKSTDGGDHWFKVNGVPFQAADSITCISMRSGSSEIWVGTTRGVYRSSNYGGSWTFMNNSLPNVRRILLKGASGNNIIAFISFGSETDMHFNAIARYKSSDNSWLNLTYNFDNGITYGGTGLGYTLFSALMFYDNDSNKILAGRYGRPLRLSTGEGDNWTGNGDPMPQTGPQVVFRYDQTSTTFPNHQFPQEMQDFVYTGMNHVVQNPNSQHQSFQPIWYSSGGAGAFRSSDGGILYNNPSNHSTWSYMVNGMSMPVVYDVAIKPGTFDQVYVPISDWTMGYSSYNNARNFARLKYDRQKTRDGEDTYIPNVTRFLNSQIYNRNLAFVFGGDVYIHRAAAYKREAKGDTAYTTRILNFFPFNDTNKVISDGIIAHNYANDLNRIIFLLGKSSRKMPVSADTNVGVYYSFDNFNTVGKANFFGASGEDYSSYQKYLDAIIPGNAITGDLFGSTFNLANGPDHGTKLLYLENAGIFVSRDYGSNWNFVSNVISSGYKDEGCLKYTNYGNLLLAMKNKGLYVSNSDTGKTWTSAGNFTSANLVEARDRIVYVFGKRSGDSFNKLYKATDNSTSSDISFSSWQEIRGDIPSIRSLTINPDPCRNDLWIGTAGQGVIVYQPPEYPSNCVADNLIISDSLVIDEDYYAERDLIIQDGAKLILKDSIEITFIQDVKIIIENGGQIITSNGAKVNLKKDHFASSWGGIEIQGNGKLELTNCTFENSSRPIFIENYNAEEITETITIAGCTFNNGYIEIDGRSDVKIENNTWNYSSSNTPEVCGVIATGVHNLLVKDNEINYSLYSSNTIGINLIYGENISIVGNDIRNISTGISISNSSMTGRLQNSVIKFGITYNAVKDYFNRIFILHTLI